MTHHIVQIYVTLLEEGTDTIRATDAVYMGEDCFKLLPTPEYDPEDEIWEFTPGTIVKAQPAKDFHGRDILLATQRAEEIS